MKIDFDEKTHTYAINGDIVSISVTELLHKHGLAPDYSGVAKATLTASAKQGKEIHKDFENALNSANYKPITAFGSAWVEWIEKNLSSGIAEMQLGYDFNGLKIAGTADVMGFDINGEPIILDHKPKGTPKEYVAWQTSLLDYMARNYGGKVINEKPFSWSGAKHFFVNFYDKKAETINVVELEKIPDTEIEKLLRCEYSNKIYERPELVIDLDIEEQIEKAELEYAIKKAEYDLAKAKVDELRAELTKSFMYQGISNWTTNDGRLSFTLVAPVNSLTVDSTKLKREFPMIYAKVVKETTKKAYLRVSENKE